MMRVFFDRPLDTVATYWRIERRDGLALGFTTHDRALFFAGLTHRASPGLLPASVRRSVDLTSDDAEVEGALSHDAIRADDLAAGLYDNAAIELGAVDWSTLEFHPFYSGILGSVDNGTVGFVANLRSAKAELEADLVPVTSPTCRAVFCGRGCTLSASAFTHTVPLTALDAVANSVSVSTVAVEDFVNGSLRFLQGPQTGLRFGIIAASGDSLVLDRPLVGGLEPGTRALLQEGCDHRLETCAARFDNAINFRGEPFVPGNDLLARYGTGGA